MKDRGHIFMAKENTLKRDFREEFSFVGVIKDILNKRSRLLKECVFPIQQLVELLDKLLLALNQKVLRLNDGIEIEITSRLLELIVTRLHNLIEF